jgi:ABC-type sugar transport system permease subunit
MNNIERKDKKKLLFYICGLAFPVLQFVVFYVIVNFNSILLAFQSYNTVDGFSYTFSNFTKVWQDIFVGSEEFTLKYAFLNSFKYYIVSLIFCTGLGLLFSNYIYKKNFGHKFFQIILFMPKILSVVVLAVVFTYSMNEGAVYVAEKVFGMKITPLFFDQATKFNYIMVFAIWSSFGTGVLMYTSTMTGISTEIVESAQLDGITPLKEMLFITLPMIYPTLSTFLVVNFAAIFTDQMQLYTFYGLGSAPKENWTVGFYIYKEAQLAAGYQDYQQFAYLSALGLMLSAVAIPLTLLFKRVLEKIGPSAE